MIFKRTLTVMAAVAAVITGIATPASAVPSAGSSSAARYRLNPARNIRPPQTVYRRACRNRPHSPKCTRIMVAALDHARGVMNEPRYHLPARFASLDPRDQLLVLSNADRTLYGRAPLTGRNPRLERNANVGARQNRDPSFVMTVNGAQVTAGASNWAGGSAPMGSALFAYYLWMYDDGPGSGNIDCHKKGDPGCWGHRDGTLMQVPQGDQVEMGVGRAKPRGLFSWTELYEAFSGTATIPCLPSVTGLSRHTASAGGRLVVHGFGFVQVRKVTVLGRRVRVLSRTPHALEVKIGSHAPASGYVLVTTASGTSGRTYAAAFSYMH
jgi:hypothetical protein